MIDRDPGVKFSMRGAGASSKSLLGAAVGVKGGAPEIALE